MAKATQTKIKTTVRIKPRSASNSETNKNGTRVCKTCKRPL